MRECGWHIVAGSFDKMLRVFDVRGLGGGRGPRAGGGGLKELGTWGGHLDRVCRVVVRGDKVASTSFDTTVRVWDVGAVVTS